MCIILKVQVRLSPNSKSHSQNRVHFMKKYRSILTTLIALLFYTATDILIWQRVFEANDLVKYANSYHTGWFMTLAGYALMGTLLMWGAWKDCLYFIISLFVGAFSGLEDVLYYVLDGKPLPASLPWLSGNPMILAISNTGVVGSVLFWLAMLVVFYIVLYEWQLARAKIMGLVRR
jgi:hypothetical protein